MPSYFEDLAKGKDIGANLLKGWAVKEDVGGPKTIIDTYHGTLMANEFGEDSIIITPFDNLNVIKILKEMGFNDIKEFIESKLFVRTIE